MRDTQSHSVGRVHAHVHAHVHHMERTAAACMWACLGGHRAKLCCCPRSLCAPCLLQQLATPKYQPCVHLLLFLLLPPCLLLLLLRRLRLTCRRCPRCVRGRSSQTQTGSRQRPPPPLARRCDLGRACFSWGGGRRELDANGQPPGATASTRPQVRRRCCRVLLA